jgi:ubiquitin-like protein Pup
MNNKDDNRKKDEAEAEGALEHAESLADAVDRILDEIDEPLEENAEEWVRSYVQKGGQGWSGFFTPEFYVGAAAAGVLSGATYDIFKGVIRRITKALLQVPGRSRISPEEYEAVDTGGYEAEIIKEAWNTASRLAKQEDIQHSIDEATALHWALFTIELEHSLGSIHLGAQRYERLVQANAATGEQLDTSQLAARIIDQWLEQREPHTRLRKAREEAGLTQGAVARQLDWSLSKVIRIESGVVRISASDLTALLRLYKVESPQLIKELMALSKARHQQGKRHRR